METDAFSGSLVAPPPEWKPKDRGVTFSRADNAFNENRDFFTPGMVDRGELSRGSYGMFGEFFTGVGRGTYMVGTGVAKTVEAVGDVFTGERSDRVATRLEQWGRYRQGGWLGRAGDMSTAASISSLLGEQLPILLSSKVGAHAGASFAAIAKLGAGATGAAVRAGQMASFSAWRYGDVLEGIRGASNGRLGMATEHMLAFFSTWTESYLDQAIGPERYIGSGVAARAITKSGVSEKLARLAAESAGKNIIGKWAANVGGEALTEFAQSLSNSLFEEIAAGPDGAGMGQEQFEQAIMEGLMAIPVAAIYGGIGAVYEYKSKSGFLKKYRQMEQAVELVNARHGERAVLALDEALGSLAPSLAEGLGPDGSDAVLFTMRTVALNWSAKTGYAPASYVEGFKTLFSGTELTPAQVQELRSITDPDQKAQWMRENVEGFREFEDGVSERFRTDGLKMQFDSELKMYRRLFGENFGADLDPVVRTDTEQTVDYKDGMKLAEEFDSIEELKTSLEQRLSEGEITAEQAVEIQAGWVAARSKPDAQGDAIAPSGKPQADLDRVNALRRLQRLRQQAAIEAAILYAPEMAPEGREGTGIRQVRRSTTLRAASSMFQALYDGKDTSWIDPSAMRAMLAEIIQINHPSISRARAIELVSNIPDVSSMDTRRSMLESAFLSEMARTDAWRHTYNDAEIQRAIRRTTEESVEWRDLQMRDVLRDQVSDVLRSLATRRYFQEEARAEAESAQRRRVAALLQGNETKKRRAEIRKAFADNDLAQLEAMLDAVRDEAKADSWRSEAEAEVILQEVEQQIRREENHQRMEFLLGIQESAEGIKAEIAEANRLEAERQARIEQREDYARRLEVNKALSQMPSLESGIQQEIFGIYFDNHPMNRVAVFFKNATEEDVLHEWFHRIDIDGLLPSDIREALDKAYGIHPGSNDREVYLAREFAARDFLVTLKGEIDRVPEDASPEQKKAFGFLKKVFADMHATRPFGFASGMESSYIPLPSGFENAIRLYALKNRYDDRRLGSAIRQGTESWYMGDSAGLRAMFAGDPVLQGFAERAAANAKDAVAAREIEARRKATKPGEQMGLLSSAGGVIDYKPQTRAFFESAFRDVKPGEIHKLIGQAIQDTFHDAPPGKSARMFQIESGAFKNQTDKNVLRAAAHSFLYPGEKVESGGHNRFFKETIAKMLGKDQYQSGDWDALSIEQMQEVARLATEAKNVTGQSQYFPTGYLNAIAQEKFGMPYEELGQTPEGLGHQKQLIGELRRTADAAVKKELYNLMKKSQREGAVRSIVAKFAEYARIHGGDGDSTIRALGDEPTLSARANYIMQKMEKGLTRFERFLDAHTDDLYTYIRFLDDGNPEGLFNREIGTLYHHANQAAARADTESLNIMKAAMDAHGAVPHPTHWRRKFGFGTENVELSLSQALAIYAITNRGRNKRGKAVLLASNSHQLGTNPDSVISDIIKFVESGGKGFDTYVMKKEDGTWAYSEKPKAGYIKTNTALNAIKAWRDASKKLHALADPVHLDQTGRPMPFSEYYFPFYRTDGLPDGADVLASLFTVDQGSRDAIAKYIFGKDYGEGVTFDSLAPADQAVVRQHEAGHKEAGIPRRQANVRGSQTGWQMEQRAMAGGPLLLDFLGVIDQYRVQLDIYRAKATDLSVINGILSSPDFRKAMTDRFGVEAGNRHLRTLANFAKREQFPYGRSEPLKGFDMTLKKIRSNAVVHVLGLKLPSMLRQTVSGLQALGEISLLDAPKYFGNYWSIIGQLAGSPGRVLDSLGGRHNPFASDGPGRRIWDIMSKHNPEIAKRYADPDLQDMREAIFRRGFVGDLRVGRHTAGEVFMGGFRVADMATVLAVYGTAYESHAGRLRQQFPSATDAWIEGKAAEFAASVVRKTQPASGVTDRNLLQTGGEIQRAMLMFTGQPMKNFQYFRNDIKAPLMRGWDQNGIQGVFDVFTKGEFGQTTVAQKAFFSTVLPVLALALIARRRFPESKEELLQDLIGFNLTNIPFFGPVLASGVLNDWRSSSNELIYYKAVSSFAKVLHDVTRLAPDKRTFESAVDAIAALGGIPDAAINAVFEASDSYTDKEHGFSWMRALSMPVKESAKK